jgi:hypothetical protein
VAVLFLFSRLVELVWTSSLCVVGLFRGPALELSFFGGETRPACTRRKKERPAGPGGEFIWTRRYTLARYIGTHITTGKKRDADGLERERT